MQLPEPTPEFCEAIESLWADLCAQLPERELTRTRGFLDILQGRSRHLVQLDEHQETGVPNLFFPGLTARAWMDPSRIPWIADLEAAYPAIRTEFLSLQPQDTAGYAGGYASSTYEAVAGWRAFYFVRSFRPVTRNLARCPRVGQTLAGIPVAREALFSILEPGTKLTPHTDNFNFVTTVHLGVVVPDGCTLTVGSRTGTWQEGRCLAIDTTYLHSAENSTDHRRAVLLIDAWHPDLTEVEIHALELVRPALEQAFGLEAVDDDAET